MCTEAYHTFAHCVEGGSLRSVRESVKLSFEDSSLKCQTGGQDSILKHFENSKALMWE